MNILNITFAQSKVQNPEFLDMLTQPVNQAGINTEKYWMVNTDIFGRFQDPDYQAQVFAHLLNICIMRGFQCLMITK